MEAITNLFLLVDSALSKKTWNPFDPLLLKYKQVVAVLRLKPTTKLTLLLQMITLELLIIKQKQGLFICSVNVLDPKNTDHTFSYLLHYLVIST